MRAGAAGPMRAAWRQTVKEQMLKFLIAHEHARSSDAPGR